MMLIPLKTKFFRHCFKAQSIYNTMCPHAQMQQCNMQRTGAVITDGGKFRVSVSVPHMGFIKDLNRVSKVVSSTHGE